MPFLSPIDRRERTAFTRHLPAWFSTAKRSFPWREKRTPYRVWISELMLQQTRADQALPYYRRFLSRFPSLRALAEASQQDVLKHWEGLGYYARARNAHRTAQLLVKESKGQFPGTLEGLRQLPGVGAYTAAAVGSLALGLDAAVVDGNVIRVLSRVFSVPEDVRRPSVRAGFQELADALLPRGRAGEFNEAMMELGAVICTPRAPKCEACPMRRVCRARAEGRPERYPVKSARGKVPHKEVGAGIIINDRRQVLLAQRPQGGMLGGLWEFPGGSQEKGETMEQCIARELKEEMGLDVRVGPTLVVVPHAFSHFTMNLHAHWVRINSGKPRPIQCDAVKWVNGAHLKKYPFPRADLTILEKILATKAWPKF